jgi:septum formation protein
MLASASPQRADLLRAAGYDVDMVVADLDRAMDAEEWPEDYVRRLALTTAEAVKPHADGRPVVAAETIVLIDGQILGAPNSADDARRMLRLLSGREHTVITAVCLAAPACKLGVERTSVQFAALSEADVEWYAASGEPMNHAGGYAIRGLASRFVTRIDGSDSNVAGLPIALFRQLCITAGLLTS